MHARIQIYFVPDLAIGSFLDPVPAGDQIGQLTDRLTLGTLDYIDPSSKLNCKRPSALITRSYDVSTLADCVSWPEYTIGC